MSSYIRLTIFKKLKILQWKFVPLHVLFLLLKVLIMDGIDGSMKMKVYTCLRNSSNYVTLALPRIEVADKLLVPLCKIFTIC